MRVCVIRFGTVVGWRVLNMIIETALVIWVFIMSVIALIVAVRGE